MFSQTAEYALRAVTCLATEHSKPLTTQQIASAAQIPAGYLSKVLQLLGRAGLVRSHRGLHGGYLLSRTPAEMTLLEIVEAVEPIRRITQCPLKLPGHANLCPLHRRIDQAVELVENAFGQTRLAELLTAGAEPIFPRGGALVSIDVNP